jgi:hypothetical protein
MPLGEALGLPGREKPRVSPAVVAHGQCPAAEVDDLHGVRMTALAGGGMVMVASVRRCGSARCYLGDLYPTWYLFHGQHLLVRSKPARLPFHRDSGDRPTCGISEHLTRI